MAHSAYREHYGTRKTPQSQSIPGQKMSQNRAGGFAFEVDPYTQLERFLILGAEGATYYATEQEMVVENAENVRDCIEHDGLRTIDTILKISKSGRAPKNEPALFALAMCTGFGDEDTRRKAFDVLPEVARIGTHLLHFIPYMLQFRRWGRGARRGVGNWFTNKTPDQLGYQFIKYAQRDGWSMRDALRCAHPKTEDNTQNTLFRYIVNGELVGGLPGQVAAARVLQEMSNEMKVDKGTAQVVCDMVVKHNLPREAVPNQFLDFPGVWDALLQNMPMTAMIRNLGKMSSVGLVTPMSRAAGLVCEKLSDEEVLRKARVHPINVLAAMIIYQQGQGFRGKLHWDPVAQVVDALDEAFYASFKHVEPTKKRTLIGLDVSGSMAHGAVNGMPFLTPREAATAMCMLTARTEKNWHIMGFTGEFIPLNISPKQRLTDALRAVFRLPFGRTDCALPMMWALQNKVPVDTFIIYTDNETWYGDIHPVQALQMYREQMGLPAKLVTCAMTATKFSIAKRDGRGYGYMHQDNAPAIADPNDGGMLDVAGLDSAAPRIIADFARD